MEYQFDVQSFRELRGISRMKFCELSENLNPSALKNVEMLFNRGWTRGAKETIDKVKDTVDFIERKDVRISTSRMSFEVTWKDGDTERKRTLPYTVSLRRGMLS